MRLLAALASAVDPRGAVGRVGPRAPSIPVDERVEGDGWSSRPSFPGFAADDITVAAQNGRLMLRAERAAPPEDREAAPGTSQRRERRTGPWPVSSTSPPARTPARIDARYADGLLVIRVSLPAPSSTERVEIPVRYRG